MKFYHFYAIIQSLKIKMESIPKKVQNVICDYIDLAKTL